MNEELIGQILNDPEKMAQLSALGNIVALIGKTETPELVEFSLTW